MIRGFASKRLREIEIAGRPAAQFGEWWVRWFTAVA
jgi:hypothetical protein